MSAPVAGSGEPRDAAPSLSPLAERLAGHPDLFRNGPGGSLEAVFGVPAAEAQTVFFPVSRTRALPDGYVPPDLVNTFGHPLRALMVGELETMFAAAERDGVHPVVVSGFRSQSYQALIFERAVQRQFFRDDEPTDRGEAERRAARFMAPPGHSQHQLGTTADLSSWEIGYALRPTFAETAAGRWLAEHAWEYGFIFPYTAAAEARTGYIAEPWHVRWVGRPLAAVLQADGYLDHPELVADDYLRAAGELLDAEGVP